MPNDPVTTTHKLRIDLGNIVRPANAAVQRAIYMAHIGTSRLDGLGDVVASLGTDLALKYQAPQIYPSNEAMVADYRWWVLSGVFRDIVEAVADCCTEAYFHLLVIQLATPGRLVTMAEYEERVQKPVRAYKKVMGLPEKLRRLEEASPGILPETTDHARSVNKARNCLVHAHGRVGPGHVNNATKDALVVRWRSLDLFHLSEGGVETPLKPGGVFQGGSIRLRATDKEKMFPLGSRVEFDEDDLVGVCFGVPAFAEGLRANVEKATRPLGHFANEPAVPPPRGPVPVHEVVHDARSSAVTSSGAARAADAVEDPAE